MSDDESEAVSEAYRDHRTAAAPQLPARLRAFVETVSVHDALVRSIRLDRGAGALVMELRAGDRRSGYFDLALRYGDVDVGALDTATLAAIGRDERAEALYDEVDVSPAGGFEHRWLWWPYREVEIRFRTFDFSTAATPDRAMERPEEPYAEIGLPAG